MKPVHIYGPVAWFGADEGDIRVDHSVGAYFLAQTVLPVPLLIEHDQTLQIGEVVGLHVEKNRILATCVVDDPIFLSLLNNLKHNERRYRCKDIGTFLNILLPSFSSYHKTDTFAFLEISMVDVGRRAGALWSVIPHTDAHGLQRKTTDRITIPIEDVKSKLITILLRQRQSPDRDKRLYRDAGVCGMSTAFVSASSLSPSSVSTEQSVDMAKPGTADIKSVLTALLTQYASETIPNSAPEEASKNAIYSSEDVKQMMLNLEKKHADRASLELAMEELVKRRVAREEIKKQQSAACAQSGKRRREVDASEDEMAEEVQGENSYTSIPVTKRVQNIMESHGRSPKKLKASRRKRASDKVQEAIDNSDTESEVEGKGEAKRQTLAVTSKMFGELNEGVKQMVSMLATFASRADGPQQQGAQEDTSNSTPVHTPKLDQPSKISPIAKDGTRSNECVLGQEKGGSCVKASALDIKPRRSIVEQIFS